MHISYPVAHITVSLQSILSHVNYKIVNSFPTSYLLIWIFNLNFALKKSETHENNWVEKWSCHFENLYFYYHPSPPPPPTVFCTNSFQMLHTNPVCVAQAMFYVTSIKLVVSKSYSTIAIVMISTSIPLNKIETMDGKKLLCQYFDCNPGSGTQSWLYILYNGPKTINKKLMYTHGHIHA